MISHVKIAIVGGSGYTGIELIRLLLDHPRAEIVAVTSRTEAGRSLVDVFPNFRGDIQAQRLTFEAPDFNVLQRADLIFFATPNGTAMQSAQALLDAGKKVIDLAADFRLKQESDWLQWYGMKHAAPLLLQDAVYGLADLVPEQVKAARLVANPGCYPTSVQLPLKPLIKAGLIDLTKPIIADCKSGVSGAGRSGKVQHSFSEVSEDFTAYGVEGHRHWIEIHNGLVSAAQSQKSLDFTFTPHLLPMPRGIFSTIYASLAGDSGSTFAKAREVLQSTYKSSSFVQLLPVGEVPHTKSVRGSNSCHFNLFLAHSGKLVITSVIDNLLKGAAGQAVQNMNIMYDFPETTGLSVNGIVP